MTQLRSSHEGAVDEIFRSVHWLIHLSNKYIFYKLALIHWLICHSTIHKNLFLVRVVFKLVFCKSSLCVLEDFPLPTLHCDSPLKGWSEWRKVSLYTADDDDAQKSPERPPSHPLVPLLIANQSSCQQALNGASLLYFCSSYPYSLCIQFRVDNVGSIFESSFIVKSLALVPDELLRDSPLLQSS